MIIMRKKILIRGLAGAFALLLMYLFLSLNVKPKIDTTVIRESAFIEYPAEFNYRQSKNDCGPFNTAAAVRVLKGENADSASFAKEIGWRLPNKYTLPWGLENQLKEHGVRVEKPDFKLLTDDEKITLIQEYLSLGMPVIILGERDGYEHYITILGFDSNLDQYYIYDSLQAPLPEQKDMTIDENADFSGNKSMKSRELMDFWRGGGMYGLWKWYGLAADL